MSKASEFFVVTFECEKCGYRFKLKGTEENIRENKFFNSPKCECGGKFKEAHKESDD